MKWPQSVFSQLCECARATPVNGTVWNSQDGRRVLTSSKRISRNVHIGDLRSGHFSDLPIISLWEKFQLPLNATQFAQYAQKRDIIGPCWWFNWNISPERPKRSSKVTWGHQRFLCNNLRLNWDRDSVRRSLCLSRRCASNDMQHDLFRWGHDLDLRSSLQLDLSRSYDISFDAPWRDKNNGVWMDPLSFREEQLLQKNYCEIKVVQIVTFCLRWPLVTSFLTWDKN